MNSRIRELFAPIERFLAIEAASGIVLLLAAVAALVWANSPWRHLYENVWHIRIGLPFTSFAFQRDLHFWINEGLMTIFFFVVGLEIRREIHSGELSDIRRAALPIAAALGGMIVPAIIFLALNANRASSVGWAVPMATDIAFAVGVFALLGKRVAPALRILLLALAVIDDVGAIIVIAFFYSSGIAFEGFALLSLGILAILAMQRFGFRAPLLYVLPRIVVWSGAYAGGIHPTLAGVIIGLLTPVSVIQQIEGRLHGWVAFGIMPLFAFANAGVGIGAVSFKDDEPWIFAGIVLGLVMGKPLGIFAISWLATHVGATKLPRGVRWSELSVVGIVGGVGFTMALFIAQLAFPNGPALEASKLAILFGSAIAGVLSLVAGYRALKLRE